MRELAAATVVHVITPKDGNVERPSAHAEDVVLLRLALRKIAAEGGEGGRAFRERFAENYGRLDEELGCSSRRSARDVISWLDSSWPALLKAVYASKKISMFVDDEEVGHLPLRRGPAVRDGVPDHREVAGRPGQAGAAVVDHLQRKREQDKKKIQHP